MVSEAAGYCSACFVLWMCATSCEIHTACATTSRHTLETGSIVHHKIARLHSHSHIPIDACQLTLHWLVIVVVTTLPCSKQPRSCTEALLKTHTSITRACGAQLLCQPMCQTPPVWAAAPTSHHGYSLLQEDCSASQARQHCHTT